MKTHCFAVQAADLKRGPIRVAWPVTADWLRHALRGTDATPTGDGSLEVELTENGTRVVIRGRASAPVSMPCARTLEPVPLALSPEIFLILTRAPAASGSGRERRGGRVGKIPGHGRPATRPQDKPGGWSSDPVLPEDLAAEDLYDGEQVVLDDFVREFLLLELPMIVHGSDLPLTEDAAIRPPSRSEAAAPDPRLMPLMALASRLGRNKE